ncbi:hypothetical protein [Deinococcus ficus]|uniref:Uncharacterized protein n=1 Tax=Deinococcus ficus TaxID=317577 RepID=A0A221T2Z6_9DEIO|nr:hypothetical protein [Deinococcus ficus]ASN83230.1 hypothetical protein DFI_18710 [Deinococcus ficus]
MTDLAFSFSKLNEQLEGEVQTRLLHPRLTESLALLSHAVFTATLQAVQQGTAGTGSVRIGCAPQDVHCELIKGSVVQSLTVGALTRTLIYEQQWPQPAFSEEFLRYLEAPQPTLPYARWQAQVERQVRHLILTTDLMVATHLPAQQAQAVVLTDESMRLGTGLRLSDGTRVQAHPPQQA